MSAARSPNPRGARWAVLAVLGGCSGQAEAPAARHGAAIVPTDGPRPDIVMIVVDGIRKDSRPEEDQSGTLIRAFPNPPLAELDGAYATSASVFTSFASMLTGLYPAAIPICRPREGSSTLKGSRAWCTELPTARPSLPDILTAYGYDTAFLSTGGAGFDTFAERFAESIDIFVNPADQPPGGSRPARRGRGQVVDGAQGPSPVPPRAREHRRGRPEPLAHGARRAATSRASPADDDQPRARGD